MKTKYVLLLTLISLFFGWIFQLSPSFLELFYFNGVFRLQRMLYDYSFGWLGFSVVYLFFIALIIYLIIQVRKLKCAPRRVKITSSSIGLLKFVLIGLCLFYWNWGFNYLRPTIKEKWQTSQLKLPKEYILSKISKTAEVMDSLSNWTSHETWPEPKEDQIRKHLRDVIHDLGYNQFGQPRVRQIYPNGILLRFSTAGIYFPFVFEGHIDAGLHQIQKPFTMAHEMAHAFGFTDEGECNFLGYLTAIRSKSTPTQYSGHMAYLRYLLIDFISNYPDEYPKIFAALPERIKDDIKAIREEMLLYPDIMPQLRDVVYDSYLKANGVSEGLKSYSAIIELLAIQEARTTD